MKYEISKIYLFYFIVFEHVEHVDIQPDLRDRKHGNYIFMKIQKLSLNSK